MLSGAIWALFWEHFIQQIYLFIFTINLLFIFYPTQLEREKIKLKWEILENSPQSGRSPAQSGRVGDSVYYVWYQAVQQVFLPVERLVHSLPKYFFKFQLWYWIQAYTTKYSNLILIIIQILVWIIGSTCIQKRRNFKANLACQQAIFLLYTRYTWD